MVFKLKSIFFKNRRVKDKKVIKKQLCDVSSFKIELRASKETLKGGTSIRSGLYLFDFIDTAEAVKIGFK